MNETSYLRAKIDNPNFDEEYVIEIDIYDILTDEHEKNNEVRMQGLNPTMFKQTSRNQTTWTNYVPIDVDPLPGDRWKPTMVVVTDIVQYENFMKKLATKGLGTFAQSSVHIVATVDEPFLC